MWLRLLWIWVALWLLMFLLGTQEYLWSGGRRLWPPLIDYGTAAFVSTALDAFQMRPAQRGSVANRIPSSASQAAADVQIAQRSPRRTGTSASTVPTAANTVTSVTGHGAPYSDSSATPNC